MKPACLPGLYDTTPSAPAPSPVAVEKKRLAGAALRVLERLKRGPATNVELVAPEVGGICGVHRLFEIRRDGWIVKREHVKGGVHRYTLVGLKGVAS